MKNCLSDIKINFLQDCSFIAYIIKKSRKQKPTDEWGRN